MIYGFGGRLDNDSNAVTMIDEENRIAETKGYINGEFVEFSGGGSSDFSLSKMSIAVDGTGASNVAMVQVSNIVTSISSDGRGATSYYKANKGVAIIYNNPDPHLNILIGVEATTFVIPDDVVAGSMQEQPLAISNIAFSGDAEIQTEDGYSWVKIMGDCTMTITIS